MPLAASSVGSSTRPQQVSVDARWLMAYAAGIDDPTAAYYDTPSGAVGHPLFPVCVEWPVVVAARRELGGESLLADEWRRGVHATHDLEIHRLVRAGDELTTVATIEAVEARKPGGYQVLRLDTTDGEGRPVATTRMGALFRGVEVEGGPAGTLVAPPQAAPTGGVRLATTPIALSAHAAHVYTETARIWNPIHTDVAAATGAGLAEPILHGTATLAMAVTEVVRVSAQGDPARVRRIAARFGAMVTLPSTITVRVLGSETTDDGAEAVSFEVADDAGGLAVSRGVIVLSG